MGKPPRARLGQTSGLEVAIDVLAVTYLDDIYDERVVLDSVHDSISTLAESIAATTRKLPATNGTRHVGELCDPFYDALAIAFPCDGLDLLHGRRLDQNPISPHYVSDP